MDNSHKNVLSLIARYPNYLLKLFFKNYPLKNEQIEKFKSEIKWNHLSANAVRDWDVDFIKEHADKLNWDALSANPSLPWSLSFLKAFPDRVKGFVLTTNPSLPWSFDFIMKYDDFWNFSALPFNKGIPWTQELILHPKIIEKNLSTIDGKDLWTEEFLLRNANILPWDDLCKNPFIPWSEELIDQLAPYWEKAEKESQDNMVSPWKGLCANPAVPWSVRLIEKYSELVLEFCEVHWKELSRNPNLPWQEEGLLERYKDKWDWNLLSINNGIGFTVEQIKKYMDLLTWDSGPSSNQNIASNENLPWSVEFIANYRSQWQWWSLCRNPSIHWTEDMLIAFDAEIEWKSLSDSISLPWSLSFVIMYQDKLFNNWLFTPNELDQIIWDKVFKPLITDELANSILYNLSNPFAVLANYRFGANAENIPQNNLELMVKRILSIDVNTNFSKMNPGQVDLFFSAIQTALAHLLVNSDNKFRLDIKLLTELYDNLSSEEKEHSRIFCVEIARELNDLLVASGVDDISKEVALKQQVMNKTYMSFRRSGGHISQDYSFLHDFIDEYGQKYLEIAKLWVFLEELLPKL